MVMDLPQPTGSLKRKSNDPTTNFSKTHSRKSVKRNERDSPRGFANGAATTSSKIATVEDEPEEIDADDDHEAGPALPPDEEDEPEDDEEGRFFGGGVSKQERDVLDYIEENEANETEEEINLAWLKKTALNFERKINKNAELRAKFEEDPMKFVSSEADLDAEIKGLSLLSEHPELYQDFVRSGCSDSLVGLLAHDNTDIAIAAAEVIAELIDEDSGAPAKAWTALVKSMLKADLAGLLVSNLNRLDESLESDNAGVYHVLNVMENLLSDPVSAEKLGAEGKLLQWLLQRIQKVNQSAPNSVDQNRQYAAEILVILAQNHSQNTITLIESSAVDVLLQLLSTWRRRDPEKDSAEEEFAENLFDCLITLVQNQAGRERFVQDEGIELCLLMIKEGKFSKTGALRVLDHATAGFDAQAVCDRIVDAGGLKSLFTLLMKGKKQDKQTIEHLLGILSSLLRNLPGGSPARIRLLAKFVEKDYEKCDRLLGLRKDYVERLKATEDDIQREKSSLTPEEIDGAMDEFLSRRLDAGLFPLQTIDIVLTWLNAEDDGARKHLSDALEKTYPQGIAVLRKSLTEQRDGVELDDTESALATKDMLQTLISCLT